MRELVFLATVAAVGGAAHACSSSSDESAAVGAGTMSTGSSGGCINGLLTIVLAPADGTYALDGSDPADPVTFTASGTFVDGASAPLDPAALQWSATREDDTPPGTIAAGVLQPYPGAGGVVTVTATDGCNTGSTSATFELDVTIGEPGNPDDWEGDPTTDGDTPLIVYPSDQTVFPRNIYRTLFQWRSQGYEEFRLIFEGPGSTVTVYTDGAHGLCADADPAAGCWEVNEVAWGYIAASNAGASATWLVDALDTSTSPPTIRRSDEISLGFSKQDVEGAIFYWSTTSAGVRRGKISKQDPEDYIVGKPSTTYSDPEDAVQCVACHVVSRDGKYMAAPVKADSGDSLWILGVTEDAPPDPLVTSVEDTGGHGFASISPDNENVVVSFKKNGMWMVERETGDFVVDLPTGELKGTHPDWRPDGNELVFATGEGDAPGGSSLALIPFAGGDWGTPEILLGPDAGSSNLFPMFSPNGQWIAFAAGVGGHGDVTAQLRVVNGAGGSPIELVNANRVTSNETTDGQYQNSQPTWAPPGDYDWIAFNTKREYGVVLAEGTQQIWVAAVSLETAEQGDDPSYPAFRVPFQGLEENNHRAYWTLDIGEGTGGGGQGGSGTTPCTDILSIGDPCDPTNDCCETGSYCDTNDNGRSYECVTPS